MKLKSKTDWPLIAWYIFLLFLFWLAFGCASGSRKVDLPTPTPIYSE